MKKYSWRTEINNSVTLKFVRKINIPDLRKRASIYQTLQMLSVIISEITKETRFLLTKERTLTGCYFLASGFSTTFSNVGNTDEIFLQIGKQDSSKNKWRWMESFRTSSVNTVDLVKIKAVITISNTLGFAEI